MANFALCTCHVKEGRLWVFGIKYHVHIINGFENHSKSLNVHCWSSQDDLGQHSLQVDEDFTWHFKVEFDGSTLFSCDVNQGALTKRFDAFSAAVEGTRCALNGECYWLVADAGIYFSTDDFTWEKKYEW
ncbi:hypothetical protein PHJA_001763300 [Phtheirospermum japonicum]|uniref:S-protein homolog n=1 Tax=Phtheirospermum japonicum TaxID=374723 RepID=A0A830CCZ2_9LAMI|nr:hypothetical protein PHJA_001763300 [Phtheirospermum japonicum]